MYLRMEIRRRVADDLGKEPGPDVSDDHVLQRSIIEALNGLNLDPHKLDEYKHFADKFKAEKSKEEQPEGK